MKNLLNISSTTRKYIIIGICVVIAIIIVAIVFKKFVVTKLHDAAANKQLATQLDEEITTENITITQQQFNGYASTLYSAMKGIGTNEERIYEVFEKMNTRSDVLQLIKTFGVKESMTLNEWFMDDLSTKEIDKINQILVSRQIDYKF